MVGCVTTEHERVLASSHPASLTFSVMCLSLLSQHGARYFPTWHLLSGDSGPFGRTKLNRVFRSCLMHTRICTQVCKFLEMISKDGVFCLLRPDFPLRCPGWPALSCAAPRPPLHTCLPHLLLSPTLYVPLFPFIPCLPPLTGLCCPSITVPCGFLSLRASVSVSHSVVPDSLRPHGLQSTRLLCP